MKTRTIKEISQLLEEIDPPCWGSIKLLFRKGALVNITKEESRKIETSAQDMHRK